jgi:8-oxo-dGTP diphosphatase
MKTSDIFVAVDAIILSEDNKVLLIKRTTEPFKGMYCLPGGYVGKEELLKDAIKREVKEETGLEIDPVAMLGVYDEIKRDPRHRTITMTYLLDPQLI